VVVLAPHREEVQSKYVPGATWVFDSDEGQSAVFSRPAAGSSGSATASASESEGLSAMDVYTNTAREVGKQTNDEFMDDFEEDIVAKENAPKSYAGAVAGGSAGAREQKPREQKLPESYDTQDNR
jgi:hypothetical protein